MMCSSERIAILLAACCSVIFASLSCSTAFVIPPQTSLVAFAMKTPSSSAVAAAHGSVPFHQRHRSNSISPLCASSSKTQSDTDDSSTSSTKKKKPKKSSSSSSQPSTVKYLFENYNKPIVLLGLSSSPSNNELQRLALSLSGALLAVGGAKKVQDTLEGLQRSQGAIFLGEDDDDDNTSSNSSSQPSSDRSSSTTVTGISLSTIGLDDEGPFVFDAELIRDLIREKTLTLTTGVLVIDFNHAAFDISKEYEVDLIRALGMVAKELYEDEKLLSVYVNVQPDGEGMMIDDAKERKQMIEEEVLIPFSDYELCIKNEGIVETSQKTVENGSSWEDMEWELQRIIARALLPSPVVGDTGSTAPNNNADLTMGKNTFFLSLSFPKVEDASPYVEQMCQDVDSMEYRVDLLSAARDYLSMKSSDENNADSCNSDGDDPRFDILYQQQRLRALCRPHAQR